MAATSGYKAGSASRRSPVKGQAISLAPLLRKVSVPNMERAGRNGSPMAAALKRTARA